MSYQTHSSKEDLIEKICYIYETDIGDFKRRVVLYLNRFSENQKNSERKKQIQTLKMSMLSHEIPEKNHMEDIDDLRFALLEKLKSF